MQAYYSVTMQAIKDGHGGKAFHIFFHRTRNNKSQCIHGINVREDMIPAIQALSYSEEYGVDMTRKIFKKTNGTMGARFCLDGRCDDIDLDASEFLSLFSETLHTYKQLNGQEPTQADLFN